MCLEMSHLSALSEGRKLQMIKLGGKMAISFKTSMSHRLRLIEHFDTFRDTSANRGYS